MKKLLVPALGLGVAYLGFLTLRFGSLAGLVLIFGLGATAACFGLLVVRPWLARRKTSRDGPPFRLFVFVSAWAFSTLLIGLLLFLLLELGLERPDPRVIQTPSDQISASAFGKPPEQAAPGPVFTSAITLASGSLDGAIFLWDTSKGADKNKPTRAFGGYTAGLTSVAYSPDGAILAFGGQDNTIRLWRLRDNIMERQLLGHGGVVYVLTFHPGGTLLASGSEDNTVRIWRTGNGAPLYAPLSHQGAVTSLAFSPDGSMLATGSADRLVHLWQVGDGKLIQTLSGHTEPLSGVAFTPDGKILLSISAAGAVRRWQIPQGTVQELGGQTHPAPITSLTFSPDRSFFASGDADKTVRLWNSADNSLLREFKGHADVITSLAFDPSGTQLISGSKDHTIRIWKIANGALKTLQEHQDEITGLAPSPNGAAVASSSADKTVRIWRLADGQRLELLNGATDGIAQLAFSSDFNALVSASLDGYVRAWDVASGMLLRDLIWPRHHLSSLAVSPDNNTIAVGNVEGTLRLWQAADGNFREFKAVTGAASSLAFSPDSTTVAVGSSGSTIAIWQVSDPDPKRVGELKAHTNMITRLAFAPNGAVLASASQDLTVRLWRAADYQLLYTLAGFTNNISAMAFSPDSKTLVVGDLDRTVRVWDVADGSLLDQVNDANPTSSLAFAGGNTILAAGSLGRDLAQWNVGNVSDMRNRFSLYSLVKFLLGSERVRLFWALLASALLIALLILMPIWTYSGMSARVLLSHYPGFSFNEARRWVFDVQLGINKIEQLVTDNKTLTLRGPAGGLAMLGGPGMLIVTEGHAAVLERGGGLSRVVGRGITWLKPFERVSMPVYLAGRAEHLYPKDLVTRDDIVIKSIEVWVFHKLDPGDKSRDKDGLHPFDEQIIRELVWTPKHSDWREAVQAIADTALRDVVASHDLQEVISMGGQMRVQIKDAFNEALNSVTKRALGVLVTAVDFGVIEMPTDAEQALLQRGIGEVGRQTRAIVAQGDHDVTVTHADAERIATIVKADGARAANILAAEGERQAVMIRAEGEKQAKIFEAEGKKQSTLTITDGERQATIMISEAERQKILEKAEADRQARVFQAEGESRAKVIEAEGESVAKAIVAEGERQAIITKAEGKSQELITLADGVRALRIAEGEAEKRYKILQGEGKADAIAREEFARAEGAAERVRQMMTALYHRHVDIKESLEMVRSVMREAELRRDSYMMFSELASRSGEHRGPAPWPTTEIPSEPHTP